jgi:hypothetical protein
MFKAILVVHGSYEETIEFENIDRFLGFSEGLDRGASLFAGGDCHLYTIEDIEEGGEFHPESLDYDEATYNLIKRHLGRP